MCKRVFVLLSLFFVLFSMGVYADNPLYLVEPMACEGTITGDISNVHPDYHKMRMVLTSLLSTRHDGSRANSLEVQNFYASPDEEFDVEDYASEVWYMGPLRQRGKKTVYRNDLSGRDDNLRLRITSSNTKNGVRTDQLKGSLGRPNTVAGSYGYNLKCKANIVEKPSRVDDFTANR